VKARGPKDIAASVRQRLLNLSKARGEDFTFVLLRYAHERLLARLARSRHADQFILKGAMLFPLWSGSPHRATKDMDLLGSGAPDRARLEVVFRDIAALEEEDGVTFLPETVHAIAIREDAIYDGVRITLEGRLAAARLPLQVDVGFGDAVVPAPEEAEYPTLLPMPAPRVRTYARETVVAEKLHAMCDLGIANSRMKDFYDVWFLSGAFAFESSRLHAAIGATFARRGSVVPRALPLALTNAFATNPMKRAQWTAFLARARVADPALGLDHVVARLAAFAGPFFSESELPDGAWDPSTLDWRYP
jgi:predicted nucleotidyltransferase component of viral defense system